MTQQNKKKDRKQYW